MKLRVVNEETGEFEVGHISDVVDKGIQPVYLITLADGKQLKATENHQMFTSEGWRTLREAVGLEGSGSDTVVTRECALMTNSRAAYQDPQWMKARRIAGQSVQQIADEAGCSYMTIRKWLKRHDMQFSPSERNFKKGHRPWNKDRKGYKVNRRWTAEHKEAIRKARSGPNSNFWRGGISSERANIARWSREQAPKVHLQYDYTCQACGERGGKLHAHHIIPVWLDPLRARDIGNLISVCDVCHRSIHATLASE
ncbi:MAG TPA: HNH endonuclease, partial [Actinomycetota bacterium]|nr:HNH endonuclease [Actinomycetota bacterium]